MLQSIQLEITVVATSTEIKKQAEVRDFGPQLGKPTFGNRRTIRFSVHPPGRFEIRLATGEIFGNPLRTKGKQVAVGQLNIYEVDLSAEHEWTLRYNAPWKDEKSEIPASIWFYICFKPAEFSELLSNIQNGVYPRRIDVEFGESKSLKFGWEPDGSAQEWDNREKPAMLPITSIEFSYEFPDAKPKTDSAFKNELGKDFSSELEFEGRDEMLRAILARLDSVRSELRGVRFAAWFLAAILIASSVLARTW